MDAFFHTFFSWEEMLRAFPTLLTEGILNTLIIAFAAIILGLALGLLLAMMLLSGIWVLKAPARVYVDIFRGLPAIVTVSLVGLGLPAAGIRPLGTSPTGYAILAVALISAAYCAEIFRSGIQSVPDGQMQAGRSLGMSHLQTMRKIIVPQGIRNVLPALTNQFIIDIKESSLVYLLGLTVGQRDLFFISHEQQANSYNSSALVAAGICYLALTIPMTYFVNWWDRRLRNGRRPRPSITPTDTPAALPPAAAPLAPELTRADS